MRTTAHRVLVGSLLGFLILGQTATSQADEPAGDPGAPAADKPGLELATLLKTELQGVEGTEVIVSRVSIPAKTSLPRHWHPGEEFGYVLEGSVTLWQEGKDDIMLREGDVLGVPLKQVHTAVTGDEGVVILVFRVHEQGKPERVLVE